jgi:regulator of sigma E protease
MMVGIMLDFLAGIFKGQASTSDVVGPVGIFHLVGEAARMGVVYVMNFTAMISMNLAVINLLPFPALDGGRLLLLFVQGVSGKKLDPEKEGFIHFIGFVILIGLMILVTFRDVNRFIL